MKNINPVGRKPSKEKLSAYGCMCNGAIGNTSTVSGNVPCNVCAYSCESGNNDNRSANMGISTMRGTHTG